MGKRLARFRDKSTKYCVNTRDVYFCIGIFVLEHLYWDILTRNFNWDICSTSCISNTTPVIHLAIFNENAFFTLFYF